MINSEMLKIILAIILAISKLGESDPETVLINQGCSQYNVTNLSDFNANLNATFAQLRDALNSGKYFATAEQPTGSDSAYALVQCRNYLSSADCIACFTAAESLIRNCSAANGARVVYLGCFLRWVSYNLASDCYNSQSDFNLQAIVFSIYTNRSSFDVYHHINQMILN